MVTPCELIAQHIGELFSCSPVNNNYGDVIDLFVKEKPEGTTLTDLGESLRWLRSKGISQRRSPKQKRLIEDICLNHGIEFYKGMLMLRVRAPEEWAVAVTRMGQAALRVANL